jgi:F-type H+-transporting ATPase subunit b
MTVDLTTFLFEVVNFVVLLWILQRLVYRPLQKAIAERREAILERERVAEAARVEADEQRASYEERRAELTALRDKTLASANEEAAEQRARILAQAREDAEAERARVRKLLEAEREAALGWVRQVSVERGTEVAGHLLMKLAPDAVEESLFRALRAEIESHDLSSTGEEVEVRCARLLDEHQVAALRESLAKARAKSPKPNLREDDSLVAGLVIRVGHTVFDGSVSGQLAAFRRRVEDELEAEVA